MTSRWCGSVPTLGGTWFAGQRSDNTKTICWIVWSVTSLRISPPSKDLSVCDPSGTVPATPGAFLAAGLISEPMATARDSSPASDRSHEQREVCPIAREVHRTATESESSTKEIPGIPRRRPTRLVLTSHDVPMFL